MRSCGVTYVSTLFQESLFYWRKRHVSCFPLNHSFPNRYLCLLNIFGNYSGMWMWFLPVRTCFMMSSVLSRHIIASWFHCIWAPFSWMASRGRVLSHSCFTSETEKECTNKSKSKWTVWLFLSCMSKVVLCFTHYLWTGRELLAWVTLGLCWPVSAVQLLSLKWYNSTDGERCKPSLILVHCLHLGIYHRSKCYII